jgi:hypothetical protein
MKSKKILIILSIIIGLALIGGVVFAQKNPNPEKQEFIEKLKELQEDYKEQLEALKEEYGIEGNFYGFFVRNRMALCNEEIKAILDEYKEKLRALKEELGDSFTRDNEQVIALINEIKAKLEEYREENGIEFDRKGRMPLIRFRLESRLHETL